MKKNNTAEKAILDAEKIASALKEGTEKTLRDIVNEAVKKVVAESDDAAEDEEPIEDESLEGKDVDTVEEPKTDEPEVEEPEEDEVPTEEEPEEDEEPEEEEWSDLDAYKVGDNDYDFTGVDDETALKVYNKLGDDDQIFIKKEEDGTYEMKDEETGAEYVIELEPDEDKDAVADDADEEEEPVEDEDEIELDINDEEPEEEPEEEDDEIELVSDDEDEPKEDEDIELELDDEEPEDEKKEEEIDENVTTTKAQKRKMVKTMAPNAGEKEKPEVTKVTSVAGEQIAESVKKIVSKARAIQAENKQYKNAINSIKKALCEAAALNVNYGKLVSLLVNETATKKEKLAMVERFNNVKTINEGTALYNTIKTELNEAKTAAPIVERTIKADSSKTINETTIYTSKENPSINLMERMDNLFKKH